MVGTHEYGFLNYVLAEFIRQKSGPANTDGLRPPHILREEFNEKLNALVCQGLLSVEEVETLVRPIEKLPYEKLALIASLQTELSGIVHSSPVEFTVNPVSKSQEQRALDWTILHIQQLGLEGLEPQKVYEDSWGDFRTFAVRTILFYSEPYCQCYWCGKIDFEGSHPVRKNRKYCHRSDCEERANSNPDAHMGCCSGEWALVRRAFKEKLRSYNNLAISEKERRKKIIKAFESFCKDRFDDNLSQKNDVTNKVLYDMHKFQKAIGKVISSKPVQERIQALDKIFSHLREKLIQETGFGDSSKTV